MNVVLTRQTLPDGSVWNNASKNLNLIQPWFYPLVIKLGEEEEDPFSTKLKIQNSSKLTNAYMHCGLIKDVWSVEDSSIVKPFGHSYIHDSSLLLLILQEYCLQFGSIAFAKQRLLKLMRSVIIWRQIDIQRLTLAKGNRTKLPPVFASKQIKQYERNLLDSYAILLNVECEYRVEGNFELSKFCVGNGKRFSVVHKNDSSAGINNISAFMVNTLSSEFRQYMFDDVYMRCYSAMKVRFCLHF